MADRHLIENREAAVGVQMFHMRHGMRWRWVLLGRPKCALPGWEAAEARRAAGTAAEASWRATRQWVWRRWGGFAEISAGVVLSGDVGRVGR
jgi:hypothetical protein